MRYDALQVDALREMINIGGGHAATSLSKMVEQPIDMRVPEVTVLSYEALYQQIIAEDQEVHVGISQIEGAFEGILLFVLSEAAVAKLQQLMIQGPVTPEVKQSMINEVTNIITNSFLMAVSQLLEVELTASLPQAHYDFFGSVISSLYLAMNQYDDQVMVIRNEFIYAEETLDASLFLIPETGVLERIFQSLGI